MTSHNPPDSREDNVKKDPHDNPGTETTVPTTEEGNTPLDERYRMTGQQSGGDVRPGSEPEAPGGADKVVGSPNQGTEAR